MKFKYAPKIYDHMVIPRENVWTPIDLDIEREAYYASFENEEIKIKEAIPKNRDAASEE